MPYNTDETVDVLRAAEDAVDGLSAQARQRLASGAYFVRLPRYEALALIAAVDALRADADAPYRPASPEGGEQRG